MPRERKPARLAELPRPSVEIIEVEVKPKIIPVVQLDDEPQPEVKVELASEHTWTPQKGGKFTIADFEIGRELGKGAFGVVYLARTKIGHFICAIKMLRKSQLTKNKSEYLLEREIDIQSHLKHPNVVRLYTYFWDEKNVYLVMEYAPGGEMFEELYKAKRFPEHLAAKYMYEIADALEYCHGKHVIHRDIKPENLLIGAGGELKIADFGWSVHSPSDRRRSYCGTKEYLAPEMLLCSYPEEGADHGSSVDVWACGVLLFEFLSGRSPFERDTDHDTYRDIQHGRYKFPDTIHKGPRDLIEKLLKVEPKERISLGEVKKHWWIMAHVEKKTHGLNFRKNENK